MRLYLLRHGEVASHRGNVPITPAAEDHAYQVGSRLGGIEPGPVRVLSGETRRAVDTADHLARGLGDAGVEVVGPEIAFALRNPDLYVGGVRVDMVSSPEALAAQVEGLSADGVPGLAFYPEFIESADRIGWWLRHDAPPGDDARAVSARVLSFATSLTDPIPGAAEVVVAVTHSPLLRAVGLELLGRDIGEPRWVAGLQVEIGRDGERSVEMFGMELP